MTDRTEIKTSLALGSGLALRRAMMNNSFYLNFNVFSFKFERSALWHGKVVKNASISLLF